MSLPPHPRAHSSPPKHRVREALWALAAVILFLLIGGTIAPDSWHHALSQKASRMWHRVRVLAKESREDLAAPTANHIQSHPEEKLPITPQPRSTIAKPAKSAPPSSDEKSWLPTFDGLVPPQQTTDLKITGLKATVVRSPEYLLMGGPSKPFVPQPWIEIAVTFSARRDFQRIAILYEVDDSSPVFSDAVRYEQVPRGESLLAAAYLIPARARPLLAQSAGLNPVRQFRAAIFESGTLLAVAESGGAAPANAEYEHGFIRPRSLTPFAPLESDLFLPDAGVAARSDLSALTGRSLTKTSPNR